MDDFFLFMDRNPNRATRTLGLSIGGLFSPASAAEKNRSFDTLRQMGGDRDRVPTVQLQRIAVCADLAVELAVALKTPELNPVAVTLSRLFGASPMESEAAEELFELLCGSANKRVSPVVRRVAELAEMALKLARMLDEIEREAAAHSPGRAETLASGSIEFRSDAGDLSRIPTTG